MANLIEQMNALKGLTDEHLKGEMSAPTGSVPPFLVLSELNRRDDMRKRYEGDMARRQQKQTTVADDVVSASSFPGAAPMGGAQQSPAAQAGIAAATPGQGRGMPSGGGIAAAMPQAIPAYADGGVVHFEGGGLAVDPGLTTTPPEELQGDYNHDGVVDYQDLMGQYQEQINGLTDETISKAALKQALITAGLGIMGGGHASTFRNIGEGGAKGIEAYTAYTTDAEKRRDALLGNLTGLSAQQHAEALAAQERNYQHGRDAASDARQATIDAAGPEPTADQRNFEAYSKMSPEERALYEQMKTINNPTAGSVVTDPRLQAVISSAQDDATKLLGPPPTLDDSNFVTLPKDQRAAALSAAQAKYLMDFKLQTYQLILSRAGEAAAAAYAANEGLNLTAGAPATGAPPTGAPVSGAVPYSDYFK